MWDDINMWLYLRLLYSELTGHIPRDEGFGSLCCEVDKNRKFRNKDYFMRKVQVFGLRIYLTFLPFSLHRFLLKKQPEIYEVKLTEKTKAIFSSAERLGFIEYPKVDSEKYKISVVSSCLTHHNPNYIDDKEKIAVSYDPGNRFISWSGLVGFLYEHHWQFVLLLWSVILYFWSGFVVGYVKFFINKLL